MQLTPSYDAFPSFHIRTQSSVPPETPDRSDDFRFHSHTQANMQNENGQVFLSDVARVLIGNFFCCENVAKMLCFCVQQHFVVGFFYRCSSFRIGQLMGEHVLYYTTCLLIGRSWYHTRSLYGGWSMVTYQSCTYAVRTATHVRQMCSWLQSGAYIPTKTWWRRR